ncbi:hypothetical protein Hanom_Chr01g00006641 [Helianthus anomalus]
MNTVQFCTYHYAFRTILQCIMFNTCPFFVSTYKSLKPCAIFLLSLSFVSLLHISVHAGVFPISNFNIAIN